MGRRALPRVRRRMLLDPFPERVIHARLPAFTGSLAAPLGDYAASLKLSLMRCTTGVPTPCFLAVLRMPAPSLSATKIAASWFASAFGRPRVAPPGCVLQN